MAKPLLALNGVPPPDRLPLHVTNKGSPKVIAALVAQLRAHPYRQLRIVF
jgi:hypothetical protein